MLTWDKVDDVQIIRRGIPVAGTLHLTPHHLIFSHTPSPPPGRTSTDSSGTPQKIHPKELWITYPMVSHCTFRPTPAASALSSSIRLRCRDFTFVTFHFSGDREAKAVYDSIKALTCKLGRSAKLDAVSYRPQRPEKDGNGWDVYDARREWRRLGVSDKGVDRGWRLTTINTDHKVCCDASVVCSDIDSDSSLPPTQPFWPFPRPSLTMCSITRGNIGPDAGFLS